MGDPHVGDLQRVDRVCHDAGVHGGEVDAAHVEPFQTAVGVAEGGKDGLGGNASNIFGRFNLPLNPHFELVGSKPDGQLDLLQLGDSSGQQCGVHQCNVVTSVQRPGLDSLQAQSPQICPFHHLGQNSKVALVNDQRLHQVLSLCFRGRTSIQKQSLQALLFECHSVPRVPYVVGTFGTNPFYRNQICIEIA